MVAWCAAPLGLAAADVVLPDCEDEQATSAMDTKAIVLAREKFILLHTERRCVHRKLDGSIVAVSSPRRWAASSVEEIPTRSEIG